MDGIDKLFLDFVAEAHRQGFKVIIDGVFNHVGTTFWAFQDVIKNGKNSKYADWFDITDWTPIREHAVPLSRLGQGQRRTCRH